MKLLVLNFRLRVPWIRDTMINYRQLLSQNDKDLINSYTIENESKEQVKINYTENELLREPLLGLNILDVGCGGGILSEVFKYFFISFSILVFNTFSKSLWQD
jgi:2-polyprenyl-3-methyl-5-hydroxy-6-metoxy-1,4-benzoquinol methylase